MPPFKKGGVEVKDHVYVSDIPASEPLRTDHTVEIWLQKILPLKQNKGNTSPAKVKIPDNGRNSQLLQGQISHCRHPLYLLERFEGQPPSYFSHPSLPAQGHGLLRVTRLVNPEGTHLRVALTQAQTTIVCASYPIHVPE